MAGRNTRHLAKAVGINGDRAAVIDWNQTNPEGWESDRAPELKMYSDIILYELHHRDFSIAPDSGIRNKGKFLALTETGTKPRSRHPVWIISRNWA